MPENNENSDSLGGPLGLTDLSESLGKSIGFSLGNPQSTQSVGSMGDYDISDFVTSSSGELQPPPVPDASLL